jgi:hypothetical protein
LPSLATSPIRYVTGYQTITSLFGHLWVYDAQWNPAPVAHLPWLAVILTQGVFAGALLFSLRWAKVRAEQVSVRVLSLALFFVLGVTNAPFAEDYHYCLILPAIVVAGWWYAQQERSWPSQLLLVSALTLLCAKVNYQASVLTAGWSALLAYPRVYGAYLLWFWLLLALRKAKSYQTETIACQS